MSGTKDLKRLRSELEIRRAKRDEFVEIRKTIDDMIEDETARIDEISHNIFARSELDTPDTILEMDALNPIDVVVELEEEVGEKIPLDLLKSALELNGFDASATDRLLTQGTLYEPKEGVVTRI